jgi:hypothetical protein
LNLLRSSAQVRYLDVKILLAGSDDEHQLF